MNTKEVAEETINIEFHVLMRDNDTQIVCVIVGCDPLHGYGSWNYDSGPYQTYREAEAAIPKPPLGWDNQPDYPYSALKGWAK